MVVRGGLTWEGVSLRLFVGRACCCCGKYAATPFSPLFDRGKSSDGDTREALGMGSL